MDGIILVHYYHAPIGVTEGEPRGRGNDVIEWVGFEGRKQYLSRFAHNVFEFICTMSTDMSIYMSMLYEDTILVKYFGVSDAVWGIVLQLLVR